MSTYAASPDLPSDSGPIAPEVIEGITLMDHPSNLNHPSVFHVRGDGWVAALGRDTNAPPLCVQQGSH